MTYTDVPGTARTRPSNPVPPGVEPGRAEPRRPPHVAKRPFLRHLGEMLVAMVVGMVLIGPLWPRVVPPDLLARTDVAAGTMATGMSVAMAAWMWHRRHTAAAIGEMIAAMYAPFLILLLPWWFGLVPADAVLLGGHLLMVPAMVLAMLHRTGEYATPHGDRAARSGRFAALADRWPTALALLVTLDNMLDPRPVSPWLLLVLPGGYLLIGAARRTLRPRRTALLQLAGLGAYAGLTVTAVLTAGDLGLYLIAAGWLGHAGWDVWHHRRGAVVPRGYAEFCAVLDIVVGLSVLAVALA